jgi:DNA-binding winged helix-turn-helix (wHTH) protein/tetratricopeptide (TPR) repeat protein
MNRREHGGAIPGRAVVVAIIGSRRSPQSWTGVMNSEQINRAAKKEGYSFGGCALSLDTETLIRHGRRFRLRPQSFAVLRYLLEQRNRLVTKEELHDAIWGDTHVTDNSLNQCLIEIRKAIGDVSKKMIRTVPRRGFIVDMPVREILSREPAVFAKSAVQRRPPGRLRFKSKPVLALAVGIAAAALILVFLQGRRMVPTQRSAAGPEPASVMRRWGGVEYRPLLVHGLTSDSDVLAATAESSFIAALNNSGVATLVAGDDQAVDPASDLVLQPMLVAGVDSPLVNVRISDGQSGESIWAVQYDATGDSLPALIDQAAIQTAYAVECGLFRRDLVGRPISPELFGMWIRACVLGANQKRVEFYELALEIVATAPGDAASHSGLAVALFRMALLNHESPANAELFARAREEANRALEIAPEFPEALIVLSNSLPYGQWQKQEELILRAFKSNVQYKWNRSEYMEFLMRVGRLAEAAYFAERNVAIARGPNHQSKFAWLLALTGRHRQAIEILDRVERTWPQDFVALEFRLDIQAFIGDPEEALRLLDSDRVAAMQKSGKALDCYRSFVHYRADPFRVSPVMPKMACEGTPGTLYARVLAAIGDVDGAFAEINAIYDDWATRGGRNLTKILFYPEMDALRRDPRFPVLTERSGLATYWSNTGQRPDYCDNPAMPYDCGAALKQAANQADSSPNNLTNALN